MKHQTLQRPACACLLSLAGPKTVLLLTLLHGQPGSTKGCKHNSHPDRSVECQWLTLNSCMPGCSDTSPRQTSPSCHCSGTPSSTDQQPSACVSPTTAIRSPKPTRLARTIVTGVEVTREELLSCKDASCAAGAATAWQRVSDELLGLMVDDPLPTGTRMQQRALKALRVTHGSPSPARSCAGGCR